MKFSSKEMLQLLWLVYEKETDNAFLFPPSPLILKKKKKSLKYLSISFYLYLARFQTPFSNFFPFLREQTCLSYSVSNVKLS